MKNLKQRWNGTKEPKAKPKDNIIKMAGKMDGKMDEKRDVRRKTVEKWSKNGRKTALFFTKIQSPVSGVEKWGEIEVSGGLRKIGDFIGLVGGALWLITGCSGGQPH